MATHSSILAWRIPWTEEPDRLQSMESQSWTRLSDFTFTFHFHALEKDMAIHSVFLPGESQRRGSLVGCRLWGRIESDTQGLGFAKVRSNGGPEKCMEQEIQRKQAPCPVVGVRVTRAVIRLKARSGDVWAWWGGSQDGGGGPWAEPGCP